MKPTSIDPDMTVDIMRRWPSTIRVMMRHRMLCIGCPIGIFTPSPTPAPRAEPMGFPFQLLEAMRSGHDRQKAQFPSKAETRHSFGAWLLMPRLRTSWSRLDRHGNAALTTMPQGIC